MVEGRRNPRCDHGPSLPGGGARAWAAVGVLASLGLLAGCAVTPERSPAPATGEETSESARRERTRAGEPPEELPTPPSFEQGPLEPPEPPLTASAAIGRYDARRDASLRIVIAGLDADAAGDPTRALASYQQAVRLDATNPIAFLALARHHVAAGNPEEASAFLDQARALFESEGDLGSAVDVWGVGLRAWIDRAEGRDAEADSRFDAARSLSPEIWRDELLSADELR
jgi:tetratricopeptide (TPR) repeat protein